jgi:hypothetical protein
MPIKHTFPFTSSHFDAWRCCDRQNDFLNLVYPCIAAVLKHLLQSQESNHARMYLEDRAGAKLSYNCGAEFDQTLMVPREDK